MGAQSLSYDYDVNGLRTKKTVNGITHSYVYASGKLLRDSWTESGLFCAMDFFYDYAGNPYAVFYQKGTAHQRFYYLTNLQGDVIGMVNTSSQLVAEYDYDPYGNLISITGTTTGTPLAQEVHQANPLRYRGYYLDQETGWYYLQSRYYDPMLGRFLNADSYASTGQGFLGYNMFAYCWNNPVMLSDMDGTSPYGPLNLFDYWIIHKLVQIYIAYSHQFHMEVYVCGPLGRGFLDLYDDNTSPPSYYEVKSKGAAYTARTNIQMSKYDKAIKVKDPNSHEIKSTCSISRGEKTIGGSFSYGYYDVEYRLEVPGLVVYDPKPNFPDSQEEYSMVPIPAERESQNATAGAGVLVAVALGGMALGLMFGDAGQKVYVH